LNLNYRAKTKREERKIAGNTDNSVLLPKQIKPLHGFFGEADDPAGRELAHENDMANNKVVVTAAITRDVIAGLDLAFHLPRKMLGRSLIDTRVKPACDHCTLTGRMADHDAA
jgi:hypothetical protein